MTAAASGLGACGQAEVAESPGKALSASLEQRFDKEFLASVKPSCLTSARGAGASAELAEAYCTCFVDKLAAWTVQEKMAVDPSSEKFRETVIACQLK